MTIPKRTSERLARSVSKFQGVLKLAEDRDVNEADTVSIIKDMLAEVFGYDKYLEITSEFQVRGTYCDLAIKVDNKVEYLIEAKAIGTKLKDIHLRQALEYGATKGVQWVILTNGRLWSVYKIKFEQPINYDLICELDFSTLDPKNDEHIEKLFLLCREGLSKDAREEYHARVRTVNRFTLGALLLTDEVVGLIRRELRKLSDGVLVSPEDIAKVLTNEVIKREVLEGDEAAKVQARVRRFYGRSERRPRESASADADREVAELPAKEDGHNPCEQDGDARQP